MSPDEFEALLRRELQQRDTRRRARLGDPEAQAEADQLLVNAVMTAAGHAEPEDSERVLTKARRARRRNEDAAFGEAS